MRAFRSVVLCKLSSQNNKHAHYAQDKPGYNAIVIMNVDRVYYMGFTIWKMWSAHFGFTGIWLCLYNSKSIYYIPQRFTFQNALIPFNLQHFPHSDNKTFAKNVALLAGTGRDGGNVLSLEVLTFRTSVSINPYSSVKDRAWALRFPFLRSLVPFSTPYECKGLHGQFRHVYLNIKSFLGNN